MGYREWREVKLEEVIEFDPTETLKKGTLAKKIGMDKLNTFDREIQGFELTEFNGGSKFRNGDTLLARITPCLENGKTAQVRILDRDEIAFGSTEFIVLREKPNETVNDFIYYLAISEDFRNIAIKSMTGTSGRQRAQKEVLQKTVIKLPTIEEQKVVAHILSTLDDKIEINNQINEDLQSLSQLLFKHWFIDFEFRNEEGLPYKSSGGEMVDSELGMIPKGWEVTTLNNIGTFKNGKGIKEELRSETGINSIFGSNGIIGKTNETLQYEPCIVVGRVGAYCGSLQLSLKPCWVTDNAIIALPTEKKYLSYLYFKLLNSSLRERAGGSAQPLINQSVLNNIKIVLPQVSLLEQYSELVLGLMQKIECNIEQNTKLENLRDTLLPKLMSGEIDLSNLQI